MLLPRRQPVDTGDVLLQYLQSFFMDSDLLVGEEYVYKVRVSSFLDFNKFVF